MSVKALKFRIVCIRSEVDNNDIPVKKSILYKKRFSKKEFAS